MVLCEPVAVNIHFYTESLHETRVSTVTFDSKQFYFEPVGVFFCKYWLKAFLSVCKNRACETSQWPWTFDQQNQINPSQTFVEIGAKSEEMSSFR